jgi:propionate CoA-transferase
VFQIGTEGLELIETAPGLDAERDVIAHMGLRPMLARQLSPMDPRIFDPGPMGLAADVHAKPRGYRSARVARWVEARQAGAQR